MALRRIVPSAVLALAMLALAVPALAAERFSSKVVDCSIQATKTAEISSARGMSCRAAAKEMQRYAGNISRRFKTPSGFTCTRVSGGQFGGQWRCTKAPRAFRFEFAD